jgi:hypothetical protein
MWKQQTLDLSRPKLYWFFAGPAERAGAPWPRRRPLVMAAFVPGVQNDGEEANVLGFFATMASRQPACRRER